MRRSLIATLAVALAAPAQAGVVITIQPVSESAFAVPAGYTEERVGENRGAE